MEHTRWEDYGRSSGNAKCQDCMVHCGYEPAAVEATFGSFTGLLSTVQLLLFGPPRTPPLAVEAQTVSHRKPDQPKLQSNGLPALPILNQVA